MFLFFEGLYMWLQEMDSLLWCKNCLQREQVYLQSMKMVNSISIFLLLFILYFGLLDYKIMF